MNLFTKALFVVGSDGNIAQQALNHAIRFCSDNGVTLNILCVAPDLAPLHFSNATELLDKLLEARKAHTHAKISTQIEQKCPSFDGEIFIKHGKTLLEVLRQVAFCHYDLVIKEVENPHWINSIFGSDDLHLIRKCPCATWLIQPNAPVQYERVGLALDFSGEAVEEALNLSLAQHALNMAYASDEPIHLISAYDAGIAHSVSDWADNAEAFEQHYLEDEYKRRRFSSDYLIQQVGANTKRLEIQTFIIKGEASTVVPMHVLSKEIDLLVMGSVGRAGILGLLIGNTAESILAQINCSLLTLKPEGFRCPIKL
ncbi:universal stress protein [Ningiella sp. W23]|uniref:universal stress protein n=1 Tax=Ningiella sp. W23 TaxID=3023715 RepID=UPI003757B4BF